MEIKKFKMVDKDKINNFLRECYAENKNMTCWLPQRFEDLIYRIDTLYEKERNTLANKDFIYYWEENEKVVSAIFPDGDSFNTSIKKGYEYLFSEMLDIGEKELLPLFSKNSDGTIDFIVISHDSLKYQQKELLKRNYIKQEDSDYDNAQYPQEKNYNIELPNGFKQVYGEKLDEIKKINTCHYGFHPIDDNNDLTNKIKEGYYSYQARKATSFYKDSFESLIIKDDNEYCSYCFCYVDKITSTAFIEPVSTREKYRKMGFARQMLYGTIMRLKKMGIEKCYINSYAWRKKVYNASGFETEDSIGFWIKKI